MTHEAIRTLEPVASHHGCARLYSGILWSIGVEATLDETPEPRSSFRCHQGRCEQARDRTIHRVSRVWIDELLQRHNQTERE
jgi:hypothetical protein